MENDQIKDEFAHPLFNLSNEVKKWLKKKLT